jgi:hypothetical protein
MNIEYEGYLKQDDYCTACFTIEWIAGMMLVYQDCMTVKGLREY